MVSDVVFDLLKILLSFTEISNTIHSLLEMEVKLTDRINQLAAISTNIIQIVEELLDARKMSIDLIDERICIVIRHIFYPL
tara:strand:+ start:3065 stop:3307 length:243 start_codon:yes stop_codon:yes gene_type:complete